MRFLADLPDEDVAELDSLARRNNRSRAAELREAVRLYLASLKGNDWITRGFGYWKERRDFGDPLEYQRALRDDRDLN